MKLIYKYEIHTDYHNIPTQLNLPVGSKLLGIDTQGRSVYAWFEIDQGETLNNNRNFYCMYTGHSFEKDNLQFRKTISFGSRNFVVHIYEEAEDFLQDDEMRI